REAEQLNRKTTAERGETGPDGKSQREKPIDIDADRFRHAPVIDGGADLRANIRLLERVPQNCDKYRAQYDQERPIAREMTKTKIDFALQPIRQRYRFRDGSVDVSRSGDRHEREADRQQDLLEIG